MTAVQFNKAMLAAVLACLAGCAGMPDMSKVPIGQIASLVPGGSRVGSLAESGVSIAKDASDALREVPDDEEVETGENVMAGILGAANLYPDDRVQNYVNQVGRWIAMHSERPTLPWRFAVLNSALPNAGAAPGGQIYITTGLLFRMRNESELAGALAHEIAHVVQRHHIKAYQKQKWGSVATTGLGAAVDASRSSKLGGAGVKSVLKFGIGEVRKMILLKLDRTEEEQADRMGMVLAARAGYDPFGLPSVIQLLQDLQKGEGEASVLYSTHPTPADRLAALDQQMSKEMERYAGQATLPDRFVAMMLGSAAPAVAPAAAPARTPAGTPARTPTRPPAKTPPKK